MEIIINYKNWGKWKKKNSVRIILNLIKITADLYEKLSCFPYRPGEHYT